VIPTKANPSRSRGSLTDHFGATSVASALGIRPGATPFGPIHPNMTFSNLLFKVDTSTRQRLGHFYLALTVMLGSFPMVRHAEFNRPFEHKAPSAFKLHHLS
jgi:hypothetical protein